MRGVAPKENALPPHFVLPGAAIFHFKEIDREHQELFDILNSAAAQFASGATVSGADFAAHITELRDRMAIHFAHEETEMVAAAYGGARSHAEHHAAVLAKLDRFHAETRSRAVIAAEATFVLLDRLLDDVLRADLAFKDFLVANGLVAAR